MLSLFVVADAISADTICPSVDTVSQNALLVRVRSADGTHPSLLIHVSPVHSAVILSSLPGAHKPLLMILHSKGERVYCQRGIRTDPW